jgi:hypothetical protein
MEFRQTHAKVDYWEEKQTCKHALTGIADAGLCSRLYHRNTTVGYVGAM